MSEIEKTHDGGNNKQDFVEEIVNMFHGRGNMDSDKKQLSRTTNDDDDHKTSSRNLKQIGCASLMCRGSDDDDSLLGSCLSHRVDIAMVLRTGEGT